MAVPDREIEDLLTQLRSDDPPVDAETTRRVLVGLRAKSAALVAAALARSLHDPDPEYRCVIASLFLAFDFTRALQEVAVLLHDADEGVRGFLCMELGARRQGGAVPLLRDALLHDADATNRTWAAWALGNIGDPAAVPDLQLATQTDAGMDHEGRPVKEIAAEAIRRIEVAMATPSVA